jgi:uncharacterized protein GlcG (DUF336 family)
MPRTTRHIEPHAISGGDADAPRLLTHENDCIGAIGGSGVQSHEDEQIAEAGASTLG